MAGNSFRAVMNARTLRNGVTFNWEMISATGEVLATGLEFLIVDDRQRILVDYQFIVNYAGRDGTSIGGSPSLRKTKSWMFAHPGFVTVGVPKRQERPICQSAIDLSFSQMRMLRSAMMSPAIAASIEPAAAPLGPPVRNPMIGARATQQSDGQRRSAVQFAARLLS